MANVLAPLQSANNSLNTRYAGTSNTKTPIPSTPSGPAAAGVNSSYTYSGNGSGGVNYYNNGKPITNTQYRAATGLDTGAIERNIASQYSGGGGGGGGGAATNSITADTSGGSSYAAAQAAAQKANQLSYLNDQVTQAQASGNQSGSVAGSTYNDQGSSLASQLRQKQGAIDSSRKSIAISQINSIRGLSDAIQNGLKSGAVSLGNSNALDSSASNAISRIYANYGNTQRNVINNEAAEKNDAQDTAQSSLDQDRAIGLNSLNTYKNTVLDQISNDTQSKLAAIDGLAQTQGLGGQFNVDGVKDAIINNAQAKIAEADKYVQGLLGGINPMDKQAVAEAAYKLTNAGVASSTGGLSFQAPTGATTPQAALGGAGLTQIPLSLARKTTS